MGEYRVYPELNATDGDFYAMGRDLLGKGGGGGEGVVVHPDFQEMFELLLSETLSSAILKQASSFLAQD